MKIRLTVEGKELTATLIDGQTSRDFIALLPLTLTMNDLFGREKMSKGWFITGTGRGLRTSNGQAGLASGLPRRRGRESTYLIIELKGVR